jgi:metallo-beta-lactamase family protein
MKLRILGAAGMVTGSMYELLDEDLGAHFLVDCGAAQGNDAASIEPGFPFDPSAIQFVLLTHAHLDHCGRLPELVQRGFRGPVICTAPTARLAKSLLLDAADHQPGRPREAVERIRWQIENIHVMRGWLTAREAKLHGKQVFFAPFRSSHLIGAVGFAISWGPERGKNPVVVFGGDIGPKFEGNECDFLEAKGQMPPFFQDSPCYTLVLESTYGSRDEPPRARSARLAELMGLLERAAAESRVILIPAFALGRLQQVLFDLQSIRMRNSSLQRVRVFAPRAGLGADASKAYLDCLFESAATRSGEQRPLYANREIFAQAGIDISTPSGDAEAKRMLAAAFGFASTEPVHAQPIEPCDIDALGRHAPCVLVAPSGMAHAGLMRKAIACHARDSKTTIAFCGYQAGGSPGAVLMQRANNAPVMQDVPVWGDGRESLLLSEVQAEAARLEGYSGHATAPQLLSVAFDESGKANGGKPPHRVLLVHGDHANRFALQGRIERRADELGIGTEVRLPRVSTTEWINLDAPIPVPTIEDSAMVLRSLATSRPSAFRRIMADIQRLLQTQP